MLVQVSVHVLAKMGLMCFLQMLLCDSFIHVVLSQECVLVHASVCRCMQLQEGLSVLSIPLCLQDLHPGNILV